MFLTNDGLSRIWHNTRLGRAGPSGQVARVSWVQTGGGRHNTPACIAMWQSSHGHHQPAQPELQPRKIFNICPQKIFAPRWGSFSWEKYVLTTGCRDVSPQAAAWICCSFPLHRHRRPGQLTADWNCFSAVSWNTVCLCLCRKLLQDVAQTSVSCFIISRESVVLICGAEFHLN